MGLAVKNEGCISCKRARARGVYVECVAFRAGCLHADGKGESDVLGRRWPSTAASAKTSSWRPVRARARDGAPGAARSAAATDRPTRADGRRVRAGARNVARGPRHDGRTGVRRVDGGRRRRAHEVRAVSTGADDGGRTRCAPCRRWSSTAGARGARRVDVRAGARNVARGTTAHKSAPRRRWPTTAGARGARRVDGGRRRRAHGVRAMSTVVDDGGCTRCARRVDEGRRPRVAAQGE
jgi:hypothetical protein